MQKLSTLLLLGLIFNSCALFKGKAFRSAQKIEKEVSASPVFEQSYTGFTLLDPVSGKILADVQGDRYFIPASTTKIFTLATCLEILKDSVPGIQYCTLKNSKQLLYRGTGDPTFLNPNFNAWQPGFKQLFQDTAHSLFLVRRPMSAGRLGPGWAWDDANYAYSPERSDWPIYGGLMRIFNAEDSTKRYVEPPFFQSMHLDPIQVTSMPVYVGMEGFNYYVWPKKRKNEAFNRPILHVGSWIPELLADTTHSSWQTGLEKGFGANFQKSQNWRTIYATPIDTVLRRMMHQSDNFVAEQMLLVCAGVKFDTLDQKQIIHWVLDSCLTMLPQRPKWVDGSGLSRYNLMSPQSVATVLLQLWKGQQQQQVLRYFPAGGVQGTLSELYTSKDGKPFVFAKSGSMSGVQCLSGYLVCKSGKVLIFTFMHNNFIGNGNPWNQEMHRILELIHNRF